MCGASHLIALATRRSHRAGTISGRGESVKLKASNRYADGYRRYDISPQSVRPTFEMLLFHCAVTMAERKMSRIVTRAAVAALFLLAALLPSSAQDNGTPGQFDFYVLSLSWSPSF